MSGVGQARGRTSGRVEGYLSSAVVQTIRAQIAEAGGNEVFFVANTDLEGMAVRARAFARGHESAVPALTSHCAPYDVVIHNHPSGVLVPSEADVSVASALGQMSVATYIVDNAVTDIYVVAEPFERTAARVEPLGDADLSALGTSGALSRTLEGFEPRPIQHAFARAVGRSINEDRVLLAEAPTGTGKSMAYLLPAARWAARSGERVLVSTNTINLQEQLIDRDIPALARALERPVEAVLVKGRTNYACQRKVESLAGDLAFHDSTDATVLRDLVSWARTTRDGSRSDLGFVPPAEAWEEVQTEADTCTGVRCAHYRECFFNVARRRAAQAHVLVVNHHLLCADLSIRRQTGNFGAVSLLPPYHRVVVDEAQHLEDVATDYFGVSVSRLGVLRLLGQVHRSAGGEGGVLSVVNRKLANGSTRARSAADLVTASLIGRNASLRRLAEEAFGGVPAAFGPVPGPGAEDPTAAGERKLRLTPAVRQQPAVARLVGSLLGLTGPLREHAAALSGLADTLEDLPASEAAACEEQAIQTRALAGRILAAAEAITGTVAPLESDWVAWLEVRERKSGPSVRLMASPIDVGPALADALLARKPTVVLTSATLTVDTSFDHLGARLGIDRVPPGRVDRLVLDSPFDFAEQALLAVPVDMPDPDDPAFPEAAAAFLERALSISRGRAFVLTTSFRLLSDLHHRLSPGLSRGGCTVLRQGDAPRHRLLERFRREPGCVLFGTDSFWEGVDVRGPALSLVVITRLPFRVPTEPIVQSRVEAIEASGGNAFRQYLLPQAVLRLKQGFGRLIRSRDDRGAVVVLDRRIVTKSYGRTFLASLPPARRAAGPASEVLECLADMFGRR